MHVRGTDHRVCPVPYLDLDPCYTATKDILAPDPCSSKDRKIHKIRILACTKHKTVRIEFVCNTMHDLNVFSQNNVMGMHFNLNLKSWSLLEQGSLVRARILGRNLRSLLRARIDQGMLWHCLNTSLFQPTTNHSRSRFGTARVNPLCPKLNQ